LLITTAIGLMLGTGAFAQSPSEQPRTNTPPAGQSHTNSNSSAAASPTASSPSSTPSAQNAQSTPSGTPKSATTTSRSAPTTTGRSRLQAVGTVVPRDVRFQPLPPDVVEVLPQYRGYNFFVVRNDIAIVDPSS
jgi:hypothetical protein